MRTLPQRAINRLRKYLHLSKSLFRSTIILRRQQREAGVALTAIILTGRLGDICAAHAALPGLAAPGKRLIWLAKPAYTGLLAGNPAIHAAIPVTCATEALLLRRLFPKIAWSNLHIDKSICDVFKVPIRNPNEAGIDIGNFYQFGSLADIYARLASGQTSAARPIIHHDTSFDMVRYLAANFADPEKPLLALHAVSEEAQRSWPACQVQTLAKAILAAGDCNICEFGLSPQLTPGPRIATVQTTLTLSQQAALIAGAKIFIGVDSAFAHLANAYAIPSILLIGDYRNFTAHLPWRLHRHDILLRTGGDTANIPPAIVFDAFETLSKDTGIRDLQP